MVNCNPVRQILQYLETEFRMLNANCLHFNVENNALILERTIAENKKFSRRFCRCLRLVDTLQPETSTFYKDKSQHILQMLHHVSSRYDDLKRRYLWALDQIAELNIKLKRLIEDQQKTKATSLNLGNSWEEFCECIDDESSSTQKKSKDIENVDKLLGMMLLSSDHASSSGTENTEYNSGKVGANMTKSTKLTKFEDFPQVEREEEDNQKGLRISAIFRKLRKSRSKNPVAEEEREETASATENKMGMYALMAEIAERDELIDSMKEQMKMKDTQISELLNVIRQEKLGL